MRLGALIGALEYISQVCHLAKYHFLPSLASTDPSENTANIYDIEWDSILASFSSLHTADQASSSGLIQGIPTEHLDHLLTLITINLKEVLTLPLIANLYDVPKKEDLQLISKAFDSSLIALYILQAKEIPRTLLKDELLNLLYEFLNFMVYQFIIPIWDSNHREIFKQKFKSSQSESKKKTKKGTPSKKKTDSEEREDPDQSEQVKEEDENSVVSVIKRSQPCFKFNMKTANGYP